MKLNSEVVTKILRKKIIWGEIRVKENEFKRIQNQIRELEQAKSDILFEVQNRLEESQKIAEELDAIEFEHWKEENL